MVDSEYQFIDVTVNSASARLWLSINSNLLYCDRRPHGDTPSSSSSFIKANDVLWLDNSDGVLELSYIRGDKVPRGLVTLKGSFKPADTDAAQRFCETTRSLAYRKVKPCRNLKVVVNPHGGPGKATQIYKETVEPILIAARCTYDTTFTNSSKHASKIAEDLDLNYDAIVLLSGDGIIHEILNGFQKHRDSDRAFEIPIAPIPTGSGNGTSINLLGIKYGFDIASATLNAVKGLPMKTDVCNITQGDRSFLSFMSQAMGVMADLDLGTEHLRWMGDTRFMYGFLRGLIKMKPAAVQLSLKVVEQDKVKMAELLRIAGGGKVANHHAIEEDTDTLLNPSDSLSPTSLEGEWITFDKPMFYVYAGKGPYVARDLMQFPVSLASDGYIDVVAQELSNRSDFLKATVDGNKGLQYWLKSQHYYKAQAYRVAPTSKKGLLSIDGEAYPFEPFEVTVIPRLATFLSPTGRYASDYDFLQTRPAMKQGKAAASKSKGANSFMCCRLL